MCFACNLAQIGDRNGELTARMNVEQLMEALGVNESDLSPSSSEFEMQGNAAGFVSDAPDTITSAHTQRKVTSHRVSFPFSSLFTRGS